MSSPGGSAETETDRTEPHRSGSRIVIMAVAQFALAGLVALTIVGLATGVASRRVGEREAIADARTTTLVKAQGIVQPALTDALIAGDATAIGRVSDVVRKGVLDGSLVRVKIWTRQGTIVFSDERALIGTTYRLGADELNAITSGRIEADVSDLSKPENSFERHYGKLLEVYLPVSTPTGNALLFEAYYRYDAVVVQGTRLWKSFAPIAIGALIMLELVQIPLAWSLARRLRQRLREREQLLRRALEASDVERRQIASDLHDGAVQDLAGVAYALSAAGRGHGEVNTQLTEESADTIRASVESLRSLIVDIYPPDFNEVSFSSALGEIVDRAQLRGIAVKLDLTDMQDPFPSSVARLLYRAAQEGVRNALSHADAATIRIVVGTFGGKAVLEVIDDGKGLDAQNVTEQRASGHLGLVALRGLVMDAGGTVEVRPSTPTGVTLHVEVPL